MKTIKRIVAAVDFSVYSPQVLENAGNVAERHGAEVIAVSVINKRLIDAVEKTFNDEHPGMFSLKKFLHDEERRRTQNLEELIRAHIPARVVVRTRICAGVPFEEILAVVRAENADLLIIAPKGRTNLPDYLFGTTSEKLFRHCPVTVMSLNPVRA